jgi:hypothetical protein
MFLNPLGPQFRDIERMARVSKVLSDMLKNAESLMTYIGYPILSCSLNFRLWMVTSVNIRSTARPLHQI